MRDGRKHRVGQGKRAGVGSRGVKRQRAAWCCKICPCPRFHISESPSDTPTSTLLSPAFVLVPSHHKVTPHKASAPVWASLSQEHKARHSFCTCSLRFPQGPSCPGKVVTRTPAPGKLELLSRRHPHRPPSSLRCLSPSRSSCRGA